MAVIELLFAALVWGQSDVRADDCQRGQGWIPRLELPLTIRQGDRVPVRYGRTHGPDGTYPLSPKCLRNWKISDPRVKLTKDRLTILVPPDLPPGTEVTILADYDDGHGAAVGFQVIARDAPTLAGTWRETAREGCEGRRIAEMVFSTAGRFSYTVPEQMVETMVTGAGDYRWDAATGALAMGSAPNFPWRGTARRAGGTLVLEGINPTGFQLGETMPLCRITFSGG